MTKIIVVFLVLLAVAAFLLIRYRRHVQMAFYVWKMFKKMRETNGASRKEIRQTEDVRSAPLVRCGKCGTWTPQSRSVSFRSGTFYCSTNCLEKAVN